MYVKTGWNTDFGKQKFDVGLDETDLARILSDANIPPDTQLTSAEAFRLLFFEAEHFSEITRAVQTQDAEARKSADAAEGYRDNVLGKLKARLGLEPDER